MSLETDHAAAERKAGEPANPCVMVIFGAAGDLTKRKLIPALYNLAKEGLLSPDFAVIGIARREMSMEEFRGGNRSGRARVCHRRVRPKSVGAALQPSPLRLRNVR